MPILVFFVMLLISVRVSRSVMRVFPGEASFRAGRLFMRSATLAPPLPALGRRSFWPAMAAAAPWLGRRSAGLAMLGRSTPGMPRSPLPILGRSLPADAPGGLATPAMDGLIVWPPRL